MKRGHSVKLIISEKEIDTFAVRGRDDLDYERMPAIGMPKLLSLKFPVFKADERFDFSTGPDHADEDNLLHGGTGTTYEEIFNIDESVGREDKQEYHTLNVRKDGLLFNGNFLDYESLVPLLEEHFETDTGSASDAEEIIAEPHSNLRTSVQEEEESPDSRKSRASSSPPLLGVSDFSI